MHDLSDDDRHCPYCEGRGYNTEQCDGQTRFYDCWHCAGTGGSGPVVTAPASTDAPEADSSVAAWFNDAAGVMCLVIMLIGGMHIANFADPRSDACIVWGEC